MKNYDIAFTATARSGLLEIGEFIALDNPARADSFVNEITVSLTRTLSIFPYSWRIAEDFNGIDEIRITSYWNYNILYCVIEDKQVVEILFVFNASRDIQAFKGKH